MSGKSVEHFLSQIEHITLELKKQSQFHSQLTMHQLN